MTMHVGAVAALGAFSLIGGLIGFFKAKSLPSLVAGGVSGVILLGGAHFMHHAASRPAAWVSLGVALLLGSRFGRTWMSTRRLMPDLLMIILSLAAVVTVAAHLRSS